MKRVAASRLVDSRIWVSAVALLLLCMPFSMAAATGLLLAAEGSTGHAQMQSCMVECGQTLAHCERVRPRGVSCPRDFQSCKEGCTTPQPQELLADRRARTHQICVQRCEVSASLCEQGAQQAPAYCADGALRCKARC